LTVAALRIHIDDSRKGLDGEVLVYHVVGERPRLADAPCTHRAITRRSRPHRVRVFAISIHSHQNIVLVGRPQKKPAQLELPCCQINFGFKCAEVSSLIASTIMGEPVSMDRCGSLTCERQQREREFARSVKGGGLFEREGGRLRDPKSVSREEGIKQPPASGEHDATCDARTPKPN
jgi:hypothetical protein